MALRPSKISSEVLQTCNKLFSSSADATLKSKLPLSAATQHNVKNQPYRYKITNVEKPEGMPELNFEVESTTLFAELQPSAKPEFKFDYTPPKWAEKYLNFSSDNSPFPSSIKPKNNVNATYSDQQKAEDKMLQYKMAGFSQNHRSFSTSVTRNYATKGPADNSGSGKCKKKVNKCFKAKHRDCRVPNKNCPRFKILTCEQSKGSNCNLNYLDPNCTKKFAPYPSYSESCAEQLPDDPSECSQCPWRTCDSADTIEPGKPVGNKRNYSTSCSRHLEATAGVVVGPLLPPPAGEVQEHLCKLSGGCGKSKPPCKQPPGPCEVRRQKEEEKRKEKAIHIPPKPKKASQDANRMVLGSEMDQDVRLLTLDQPLEGQNSWIDLVDGETMYLDKIKPKHPNCPRNKKPKRPDDSKRSEDLSIEYGNVDWWSGRGKKTVVYKNKIDGKKKDCPCTPCPDVTIRSKQMFLSDKSMQLDKKGGKKIKGDEGNPPPCKDPHNPSLNCPEKPLKKPKYKKRPMTYPYYKRPEDPYNPEQ